MTDKDREAFETFVRLGMREGEDFLGRDSRGDYVLGVARGGWASWQAARDHYTPNLAQEQTVTKAARIIGPILLDACSNEKGMLRPWKPFDVHQVSLACAMAALHAAGVRFKEEA
jgi:hypothetical protein